MAEGNGVTTPNVTPSATLDHIMGSKGRSTRLQSVDNLAKQLMSSGPIRAALPTSGSNTLYFETKEEMLAKDIDLVVAQSLPISAWVYADAVIENNGIYRYVLGNPGVWQRVLDLPMQWAVARHIEGSTGYAIRASTGLPVSRSVLIALPIEAENEMSPTVTFDDGEPLAIVSNTGNPIVPAGLVPPMTIWGWADYDELKFRLINDQVAVAIVARAEAAAIQAVDAAVVAQRAKELAERFATAPEDEQVIPGSGLYSALHYNRKAAAVVGGGLADAIMGSEVADELDDECWVPFVDVTGERKMVRGKLSALIARIAAEMGGGVPLGTIIDVYGDGTTAAPGFLEVVPGLEITTAYPEFRTWALANGWAKNAAGNPVYPSTDDALFKRQWRRSQTLRDIGRLFGSVQTDDIKSHDHETVDTSAFSLTGTAPFRKTTTSRLGGAYGATYSNQTTTTATTGGIETRSANITVTWYIKAYSAPIDAATVAAAQVLSDLADARARISQLERRTRAHLTDTKPQGAAAQVISGSAWNTRQINTKNYDPANIITLANNAFALSPGEFLAEASVSLTATTTSSYAGARFFNVTDNVPIQTMTSRYSSDNSTQSGMYPLHAVLVGGKTYRIEHVSSGGGIGAGVASNFSGMSEVYLSLLIERL